MNRAETVLRSFARRAGLRVSTCNVFSANIGEAARRRVRLRHRDAQVTIYAAETVVAVSVPVIDGRLLFAVNQPDRICFAEHEVGGFAGTLPWPVYSDGSTTAEVQAWLSAGGARRVEALAPSVGEALFVFGNSVEFRARLDRDLAALVDALIDLAEVLPQSPAAKSELALEVLPASLRPLGALFDVWAISDDDERDRQMQSASLAERRAVLRAVDPHVAEIDKYLASFGTGALPEPAIRLGELAEVAAEFRIREA